MPRRPVRRIRSPLLAWYRGHRRDLPWRRTSDPWAIWVAEVMLQQTRVETVIPYYGEFLERFPTPAALAAATEEQVLAAWSGLGYYRRARALHAGARSVMERHGGRVPRGAAELLALPGVGRYTAGAIGSIAFDRPEPVLDGNVRRVLCRLEALDGRGMDRRLWDLASSLARGRDPGRLNQALMELGALVCTPRRPRCTLCPVRKLCCAFSCGRPESLPVPRRRRPTEHVRVAVAWVHSRGRALLERPGPGSPLRGHWDLPAVEVGAAEDGATAVKQKLRQLGLDVVVGETLALLRHAILHRDLRLEIFDCRLRRGRVARRTDVQWFDPSIPAETAVSGATRKVARAVSGSAPAHSPSPRVPLPRTPARRRATARRGSNRPAHAPAE